MPDKLDIILDELREHRRESADRHEVIETRVRSLEETRAHQVGAAGAIFAISSIVAGAVTMAINWWHK